MGNLISGNKASGIHVVSLTGPVTNGNVIEGNRIGTNATGTAPIPNGNGTPTLFQNSGVSILGATNTIVGGTAAGAGNLISGNGLFGVYVRSSGSYTATGNRIEGNYIGTNAAGSAAIANGQDGVRIESGGNVVGGTTSEARNIISGNTQHGVFLTGELANDNQIQGNYIGTTGDGQLALGNGLDGIPIVSGANNLIGGSTAGAGNLISGNGRYGVLIQGSLANLNKLEGNYIGTNASGMSAIANTQSGVLIESALNVVGGTQAGARNVIGGNGLHGINLNGGLANGNSIQGNYIGLTADGLSALAPIVLGKYGIQVSSGATNNTIGGTTPEARNTISGHNVGVNLETSSNANFVKGNYIGTDFTGLNAVPNSVGVYVFHASNNIIGGSLAGAGNVISGNNNAGVVINGGGAGAVTTENSITGNLIGLKVGGLSALGNRNGVEVYYASLTYIAGNIVSGNFIGIAIRSNNTQVHGNYIGTDLSGTTAIPNTLDGVYLDTGTANYIGGLTAEEGNVISGNGRHGIFLTDLTVGSTTGNQILKNRIGTDVSGLVPLGNTLDGVHIFKSSDNFVGESPDLGNVIAFNGRNGVTIASTGNVINGILNNAIHSNGALGIDLAPLDGGGNPIFGVTANDSGDGDSGPNGLTNFPVLANATAYPFGAGMRLAVQGSLDVPVNSKVQFFRSTACDSSGNGEGQTFLGEISLAYNGSVMNFNQTLTLPAGVFLNAGDTITATAISNLGTSEFSACLPVQIPTLTINDISVNEGNSGTTNATFTVTLSNVQGAPGPITVNYATSNGSATAGSDYTATSSTLTFNAPFNQNTITQTIIVPVIGDTTVESNETFNVNLTGNVGATLIDSQGAGTIVNDDSSSCSTITVNPATLLNGLTQVPYSQTLSATGGSGFYTFSLTSGTLPAGLMLSGNMIVGTPTTAGASTFTIRATDDNNCFGERSYTIVIGTSGLMYYPLARPVRLLDTRPGASPNACVQPNTPIQANTPFTLPARGTCEGLVIPANATTITGNVTTVQSGGGFLTLYPSDAPRPTVANTNYLPNEILNNAFTVGVGANDGAIKIFVTSNTDVVIDVTGYYAPVSTLGLYFHPLPKPIRLLETRQNQPGCVTTNTPLQAGSTRTQTGVITCDGVTIPSDALALVGNATTVDPAGEGFLTLYTANATQPFVSSSNFVTGQIMNAPFTVGLSPSGDFKIYTTRTTNLVVDITGYYSSQVSGINGQGLLFTSLGSPLRLLDTRPGEPGCYTPGAPMNSGQVYTQQTQSACTNLIPTARALIGNATVVNPAGLGFLTFWPSNANQPLIATSNYTAGQIFNRYFKIGLAPDGSFKRFSLQTTHLVLDISGFFAP